MTVRITRLDTPEGGCVKVDGWLGADGLAELERICSESPLRLTLDLKDLRQADETAVSFLRRLVVDGARLVNCSPYFALLLYMPPAPNRHGTSSNH